MPSNEVYLNNVSKYVKELEKLRDMEVVVGIPASSNKIHDNKEEQSKVTTLAELGAIHEYGSPQNGIPQRSFLRVPLQMESKKLIEFIGKDLKFSKIDTSKALGRLGVKGVSIVLEAFSTQGNSTWDKLKPSTIANRKKGKGSGTDKPLIDTGQLRQGITSEVRKRSKS